MPPTKSESLLGNIEKNTKKIADELSIIVNTRTGKKKDVAGLERARDLFAGAAIGAFATPAPGGRPAAAILGAGAAGSHVLANYLGQQDERISRVFTISEALDAYEKNLKTIAEMAQKGAGPDVVDGKVVPSGPLRKTQEIAEWGNEAIVTGLAATWEGLAGQLNALRKFGGKLVDPSAEQGIIRNIEAVRDALAEILNMADDPKAARLLSRMQSFLGRKAPAGPFFGEEQAGGRIMPRFLGTSSGIGGSSGADVLFGGAGSDAIGDAARGFTKLNDQVERYKDSIGAMATGLAETNTQLGGQADWLTTVG